MFPEYTREELAAGLDHVTAEVLRQGAVARPPVDAMEVARTLGIAVAGTTGRKAGRDTSG
jgi:hypothetical protein